MELNFFSENITFEIAQPELLNQWIANTAAAEANSISTLNIIFCDDAYLYNMNVQYLDHDTLTDVITFQYNTAPVEGDIFISVERTAENAADLGVSAEQELHRVIIHGTLHLLGYGDKTPSDKTQMTSKENHYLSQLEQLASKA